MTWPPTRAGSTSASTTTRRPSRFKRSADGGKRSAVFRDQQMEQNRASSVLIHYKNWRAKPLVSYRVIVELIGATTTENGLTVRCELDDKTYPTGTIVSDQEMQSLNILRADFHGEWNYTIAPSVTRVKAIDS